MLTEAPETMRGLWPSTGASWTALSSCSILRLAAGFLGRGGGTTSMEWQSGQRICEPICFSRTDSSVLQTLQFIEYSRLGAVGVVVFGGWGIGLEVFLGADFSAGSSKRSSGSPRASRSACSEREEGLGWSVGWEIGARSGRSSSKILRGVFFSGWLLAWLTGRE